MGISRYYQTDFSFSNVRVPAISNILSFDYPFAVFDLRDVAGPNRKMRQEYKQVHIVILFETHTSKQ